ncbi:glycine betaine ABC transporter substrate-binding protein [Serpentinicella sp. ANB-PHB4]|uniref:glycine betaine ABC transporter substrate-binding protein n=1 Tax=Serpentinicella sp. ANB-PHB4 TaxID=3074076 RepID=UPI00285AE7D8|nr:glycine betaine ABC transporter substrate-binding protein [Serpentinicella sp. ANB-PHB4]MDR5659043.1 glycine betaine ABC transporter substrate-binding protein [Serpentinicella sp. ANB-PHB4]
MFSSLKSKSVLALLLVAAMIFLVGCGGTDTNGDAEETTGGAEESKEITIGYVPWDCAIASTHVMKTVLEDAGYTVNLLDPSAALLYQGLAEDDIDFITTAWLPFTHGNYMEQYGDQIDDLGSNFGGDAVLALVVPEYMDIDSIEDLDGDIADGVITGIDPGAGIMGATEALIEDYGLDYELLEGSDAVMAAALSDAIDNEEEIVVTGWSPHWKFGRWDLKMLEDPKESLGAIEDIHTLARQGLAEDMPEAYSIINNFHWEDTDIATVMDMNSEGMDPNESARIWVDENQDKVAEWLN